MSKLHKVCKVSELPEGQVHTIEVEEKYVGVYHQQGKYFAIDDFCPHMGASLSGGHVEDGTVTCPWHAWRFRLCDGAWADNPRLKVGCYNVSVVDDEIFLETPANNQPKK
ncbi:MAG: Rieske (2Fe-2S) protein [Planctomycetota bacterium]|jgi:nitrite reductase (NADH) small subunit/3-phenylpropionate/trans-cinnamate dioxygenase ferredoxin subunit|nr:Rieske (2Fe-2S) protein [Planctomycetota bacterium]